MVEMLTRAELALSRDEPPPVSAPLLARSQPGNRNRLCYRTQLISVGLSSRLQPPAPTQPMHCNSAPNSASSASYSAYALCTTRDSHWAGHRPHKEEPHTHPTENPQTRPLTQDAFYPCLPPVLPLCCSNHSASLLLARPRQHDQRRQSSTTTPTPTPTLQFLSADSSTGVARLNYRPLPPPRSQFVSEPLQGWTRDCTPSSGCARRLERDSGNKRT